MSKGILNNRDKMMWNNTHKPDISDVVAEIDDEMDDLLDDHDDKVVDIVGDNMNDLLDAHDDKVVSIVGDNMSTLLSSNAAAIRLIGGDRTGITSTPVRVGAWDATHDIYAVRLTGEIGEITEATNIVLFTGENYYPIFAEGYVLSTGARHLIVNSYYSSNDYNSICYRVSPNGVLLRVSPSFTGGSYDVIIYYLIPTETPTP